MLENLEEGHVYLVEWNDGYKEISCTFKMSHKGFLILLMIIIHKLFVDHQVLKQ